MSVKHLIHKDKLPLWRDGRFASDGNLGGVFQVVFCDFFVLGFNQNQIFFSFFVDSLEKSALLYKSFLNFRFFPS